MSLLIKLFGAIALLLISAACSNEWLFQGRFDRAVDHKDVFLQEPAAKVDILWIVDNSESMQDEQAKIAHGFIPFFRQLVEANVDYHIGVITTDTNEGGTLRAYEGPSVSGCSGCRFLNKEVECNIDKSNSNDFNCPAKEVFSSLIKVGASGGSYEHGFDTVTRALGLHDKAKNQIPSENQGFLRSDASLFLIFVSDEDEGLKDKSAPVKYYSRLLSSLKGKGNENLIVASAFTGWPRDPNVVPLNHLFSLMDKNSADLSDGELKQLSYAKEVLQSREGCKVIDKETGKIQSTQTGSRYIELAYELNGVVGNLCAKDYSLVLEQLGASAAGLKRSFKLVLSEKIEAGPDNILFTKDDLLIDCDGNGSLDTPICVFAEPSEQGVLSGQMMPVQLDDRFGWMWDRNLKAIQFARDFIPRPGSAVHVHYKLQQALNI